MKILFLFCFLAFIISQLYIAVHMPCVWLGSVAALFASRILADRNEQ